MTTVIGIVSNKGGTGKSSICNLFAITLANKPIEKRVLVIDASENKSLSYLNVYKAQSFYKIVQNSIDNVPKILAAESDNYDLIFIDFPSNSDLVGYKTASLCCNRFIVPTAVGIMDQIATKETLSELNEIKSLREAAGFSTSIKVLPSRVNNQEAVQDLFDLLDNQKIEHFEYPLLNDEDLAFLIEQNKPIMDYVTEGIDWTSGQEIFHNVFIEFHKQLESE
jgi:cellulose biosynthesis protein BcsQ